MELENLLATCEKCGKLNKPFVELEVYKNWLPKHVKTLAVGESPPPGEKDSCFYNLLRFDRMRLSMKFILGLKSDEDVLLKLKTHSTFITAAVKCRPLSKLKLKGMSENCVPILKSEIELLKPERVIAMGRLASFSISKIFNIAPPSDLKRIREVSLPALSLAFTPHPNYIFRFRRDMATYLKKLLLCH